MINDDAKLYIGAPKRAMLMEQLRKVLYCIGFFVVNRNGSHLVVQDVEFLKQMKIMDYSLLIGIHDGGKKGRSPTNEESLSDTEYQEVGNERSPPFSEEVRSRSTSMPEQRETPYPLRPAASDPSNLRMFSFDRPVQEDDSSDDEEVPAVTEFDPL